MGGLAAAYFDEFNVSYLCDLSVLSESIVKLYMDDCFETRFSIPPSGT